MTTLPAENLRFYLDEQLDVEIARQLMRRGIDVLTVRDLQSFGESDTQQLNRAIRMGRVMWSNDRHFIQLASAGIEHCGIVFGQQDKHYIGTWVRHLERMHDEYGPDDLLNHVEFLPSSQSMRQF